MKYVNDYRKIKSPEYAESQERLNALHNMVVEGREAEMVIKYAKIFLEVCQADVLRYAKEGKVELMTEAAMDYKIANKFCDMLISVAEIGMKKEETLRSIQQNLNK